MEQLLDLIFGNPLLLFLIIGAFLSFLKRGKEEEAQRETRKPGAPRAQGRPENQRNEVDWREIFQQEAQTNSAPQKSREQSYTYTEEQTSMEVNRSRELLEKYEKAKLRKEKAGQKARQSLTNSPIYKDDLTASNKVSLDFSSISRDEAIKGVVWSEILGKPRAKGSYRPTLNTRRKQG
ncbi:hypothetical protein AWH56_000365 [Anaerobacillus isosaccharinicus]|uniref:Uncharacterized protein n=1 Tax=Anaerobacillus isosaccharinicus TaxID=1532552 RepID=A0A7S7RBS0_9BACI|nr:hypothetical protein [Anaerobacillus isosaccharinicus]MBA5585497.1 hypothetical protein [Anaerobacillus isosaccharinicus]QOY36186.1 hypothetical protein AWH56_000365 [Anaerobacillus isosaccharinicus]